MTTDLKPTIALLQSLNDVYNLYMTVYAEDPNVSLSSVPIDLISNDESPLVQCMNELHALERIMDVGNRRLGEPNLANVLDNLKKIQAALDIIPRQVYGSESERCTERTYTPYLEPHQVTSQVEKKTLYVRIKVYSPSN